ncbi:hypothetical protein PR202_gb13749 [Eleusine coracana subsp. coracana]|uniref:Uncharacterized protein n=1 Tax=Eleusine coracana subsp. coracana TaxID=191504 RepID=A0AAV5ESS5_ELECO|nr:hypothetical protein PR202_gb13749 [Eleusine coracana subsp. coracana]
MAALFRQMARLPTSSATEKRRNMGGIRGEESLGKAVHIAPVARLTAPAMRACKLQRDGGVKHNPIEAKHGTIQRGAENFGKLVRLPVGEEEDEIRLNRDGYLESHSGAPSHRGRLVKALHLTEDLAGVLLCHVLAAALPQPDEQEGSPAGTPPRGRSPLLVLVHSEFMLPGLKKWISRSKPSIHGRRRRRGAQQRHFHKHAVHRARDLAAALLHRSEPANYNAVTDQIMRNGWWFLVSLALPSPSLPSSRAPAKFNVPYHLKLSGRKKMARELMESSVPMTMADMQMLFTLVVCDSMNVRLQKAGVHQGSKPEAGVYKQPEEAEHQDWLPPYPRWSRIARRLPGRTDNEIKNYWRTHMRKKAQERKMRMSPSSSSSSLTYQSCLPETNPATGMVSGDALARNGSSCITSTLESIQSAMDGYPMDQIWQEIEAPALLGIDEPKEKALSSLPCPLPTPAMWDYKCPEVIWKMGDEEIRMFDYGN